MRTRIPRWLWKTLGVTILVLIAIPIIGRLRGNVGARNDPLRTVSMPTYILPKYSTSPCSIADSVVSIPNPVLPSETVGVVPSTGGSYQLFWTGESEFPLLNSYSWPAGLNEVLLEVRFVRGHLDQDSFYNPSDSSHFTWAVPRPRDYRASSPMFWGYCPNRLLTDYPCYALNVCSRVGPGQVWVSINPNDPFRGIYDFSRGSIRAVVYRGEVPTLLYNSPNPATGRMHRAEFRVIITPIP